MDVNEAPLFSGYDYSSNEVPVYEVSIPEVTAASYGNSNSSFGKINIVGKLWH